MRVDLTFEIKKGRINVLINPEIILICQKQQRLYFHLRTIHHNPLPQSQFLRYCIPKFCLVVQGRLGLSAEQLPFQKKKKKEEPVVVFKHRDEVRKRYHISSEFNFNGAANRLEGF